MQQDIKELEGLSVKVDDVVYMPNLESPSDRPHPFVYFISIHNRSQQAIKIVGRKWVVVEDYGETNVLEGQGVIGICPIIQPGKHFSYNSYHVIKQKAHASGAFFGETEDGQQFFVRIPSFRLDVTKWV